MSVWSDMEARGIGVLRKREDKYMSAKEISKYLAGVKVDIDTPPMRSFTVLTEDFDDKVFRYVLKNVFLTAFEHPDGTRDFNSPPNVLAVCKIENIIKFL